MARLKSMKLVRAWLLPWDGKPAHRTFNSCSMSLVPIYTAVCRETTGFKVSCLGEHRDVKVRSRTNDLLIWNQRLKHFGSTSYLSAPSSILVLRGGCLRRTWLTQSSSNPFSWLAATYCEDGKSGWDWWNKRTSCIAFSNLSGNKHIIFSDEHLYKRSWSWKRLWNIIISQVPGP